MEIKIEINDDDYQKFCNKTNELGLDPISVIELIIKESFEKRDLRYTVLNKKEIGTSNQNNDKDNILKDLIEKIEKYNILQSSLAYILNITQASISRSLKSNKNNTLLYREYSNLKDKLLIKAYKYQVLHESIDLDNFKCYKFLGEESKIFFESLVGYVCTEFMYNPYSLGLIELTLCDFVKTERFTQMKFDELNNNIGDFIEHIEDITEILSIKLEENKSLYPNL